MAEEGELTSEAIQELANATNNIANAIVTSGQSSDLSWILPVIGAITVVVGTIISVLKFTESQKESKKLEFMKQLDLYDSKLTEVARKFPNSEQQFNNCIALAKGYLAILDTVSFLRTKNLVNDTFTQFFENAFNSGRTYLEWLKFTDKVSSSWGKTYDNFNKVIKDKIIVFHGTEKVASPFYYYVYKCNKDKKYNPFEDKTDTKTYIPTKEDEELIKPT